MCFFKIPSLDLKNVMSSEQTPRELLLERVKPVSIKIVLTTGTLLKTNLTERDLLSRVRRLVLFAFDQGNIKIRDYYREVYCLSTNTQVNRKRNLSSVEPIGRKVISKRPYQMMAFGNYELGLLEGSKDYEDYSTKFFLDSIKKSPKTMKDMLLRLVKAVLIRNTISELLL
ncbi:hypothetical protein EDC94DRAFT_585147 [Helicostylum pulchrum]|nr:hypothetical protein EDC94DRAFT_585147 [Helicostylum pulchrum]